MADFLAQNSSLSTWLKVANGSKRVSPRSEQNIGEPSAFIPFRLYLKEVSVPKSMFRQTDQKSYDVGINVMFYDSKLMTFDGQFSSPTRQMSLANKASLELMMYFGLERLKATTFIVVEVLSRQKNANGIEDVCLGFAVVKLFESDSSLQNVKLIGGSSRALLFIEDPAKLTSALPDDVHVILSVQPWPKLEVIKNLLPSNLLVHSANEIPGIVVGNNNMEFPAVGLDNFHDPHVLEFNVPCRLKDMVVRMRPDVTILEALIQNTLNSEVEQSPKTPAKLKTSTRKLKVGIHNGLRFVAEPSIASLTLNADGALVLEPGVSQELAMQLPHHPAFAIVFQLELVFTEATTGSVFKKSAPPKSYSVCAGWAAISPFGIEPASFPQNSSLTLRICSSPNECLFAPEGMLPYNLKHESDSTQTNDILLHFTLSGDWGATPRQMPTMAAQFQSAVPAAAAPTVPPIQLGQPTPFAQIPPPQESARQPPSITPRSFQPLTPQSVAQIPDASLFTPQKPWPMEVRHLVDDEQKASLFGTAIVPSGRNLAVTPVHIPMPPTAPLAVASLPRAAYAQLYSAGFPVIRDRHGDLPEVIDPVTSAQSQLASLNFAAEKSDPLQGNEIVFQFLALSSITHTTTASLDQPQCVFFTFQFYNFQPVQTERLLMTCGEKLVVNDPNERMSSLFVLRAIDRQTGALAVEPPGCQVKFAVDSSVLKPGEEDAFWRYVITQSLHIDIWDGDSLMLIGSCSVPIRFLLRQGKEAVQMTFEMDVFSTEYGGLTSNIIADVTRAGSARYIDVTAVLKGRLHLRLANIGFVSEMRPIVGKSAALAKIYGSSTGRLAIVESQSAQNNTGQPGSLDKRLSFLADQTNRPVTGRTRIGQGVHLLEAAGNRALLDPGGALVGVSLANDLMGAAAAGETIDDRTRKLDLFRKVLSASDVKGEQAATLAHGAAVLAYKHARDTREHGYKNLDSYRERTKHQSIISLLCDAITSRHEIVTSFGKAEYFEFMLRNPTNEQHMVRIESQDPDLTVVTDVAEWRYFRRILGEPTSVVEEKMFNVDASSPFIPEVFIKPREIIRIPFRFQTFKGYQTSQENETEADSKSFSMHTEMKQLSKASSNNRIVVVHFTSMTSKETEHITTEVNGVAVRPLAVLEVNVELQPHATDQVFRFYSPENSFLRKAIRLPPYGITAPGASQEQQMNDSRRFTVRCSDPAVIAEAKNNGPNEPQDIMLRVAVGASPNIRKVFLAIFADPYISVPVQIWELWVHALQRYDITCVEGETSRFSLVLRGSNSTRLVRCFTSHANELLVEPSIPFMLVGNAVHELSFTLKPLTAGQRLMVVNVVDLQLHQLLRSWLVCVSAEAPAYSSYFDLMLPCGPAGQTHNKKLAYKNPFGRTQSFFLKTNRGDLLNLRETTMPHMGPGEIRDIGLRFAPSQTNGTAELAVYVNDEQDRNIESVCIRLTYITTAPGYAPTNQHTSVVQRQQPKVA